jgi:bacterioferritin-associated ferredoxin
MLVCHCQRITDQAIRRCVRDGAASVAEVERACGAGGGCGGCRPLVRDIVQRETVNADRADVDGAGRGGKLFR